MKTAEYRALGDVGQRQRLTVALPDVSDGAFDRTEHPSPSVTSRMNITTHGAPGRLGAGSTPLRRRFDPASAPIEARLGRQAGAGLRSPAAGNLEDAQARARAHDPL